MPKIIKYIFLILLLVSCKRDNLWNEDDFQYDNKSPKVASVVTISSTSIQISFSKAMLSGGTDRAIDNLNNYAISTSLGGLTINSVTTTDTSATLTTDSHLENEIYTIVITNVVDQNNLQITGNRFSINYTYPSIPLNPILSSTPVATNQYPVWTWISGGGGSGIFRYKLNDSDLSIGATQTSSLFYTPSSPLSEGVHILYLQEVNVLGNWSNVVSFSVTVDLTPPGKPIVTGMSPTSNVTPTWTWTSGGGSGYFRYKLDDPDLSFGFMEGISLSYTSTALSDGSHTLYIMERDDVGQWSEVAVYSIVVMSGMGNIKYVSQTGNDANTCDSIATACRSIQKGISEANPGDVVMVEEGTYENTVADHTGQPVVIMQPDISVFGGYQDNFTTRVPGTSIINDQRTITASSMSNLTNPMGTVEILNAAITDSTYFDGFSINMGNITPSGTFNHVTGIKIVNASPTIQNNTILGHEQNVSDAGFSYIFLENTGIAKIMNNIMNSGYSTAADSMLYGMKILSSNPEICYNNINMGTGGETYAICIDLTGAVGSPLIQKNVIRGGTGNQLWSFGIQVLNTGAAQNIIIDNNNIQGGDITSDGADVFGVYIANGASATITKNRIYAGSIISSSGSTTGLFFDDQSNTSTITITDNEIFGGDLNTGYNGNTIGILSAGQPSPDIRKNIIYGGSGGANSYAIWLNNDSPGSAIPVIQQNRIKGGSASIVSYGIKLKGADSNSYIVNNYIDGGNNPATNVNTYGICLVDIGVINIENNNINSGAAGQSNASKSYGISIGDATASFPGTVSIENNNIYSNAQNAISYGIYEYLQNVDLSSFKNNNLFNFSGSIYEDNISGTHFARNLATVNSYANYELNISENLITDIDSDNIFVGDRGDYIFDTAGRVASFATDFLDNARTVSWSIGPREYD